VANSDAYLEWMKVVAAIPTVTFANSNRIIGWNIHKVCMSMGDDDGDNEKPSLVTCYDYRDI
jgi:hypothetical protein